MGDSEWGGDGKFLGKGLKRMAIQSHVAGKAPIKVGFEQRAQGGEEADLEELGVGATPEEGKEG